MLRCPLSLLLLLPVCGGFGACGTPPQLQVAYSSPSRAATRGPALVLRIRGGNRIGDDIAPVSAPNDQAMHNEFLDKVIDRAIHTHCERDIIRRYDNRASWLYTCWKGTVLRLTWVPVLMNTLFAALIVALIGANTGSMNPAQTWPRFAPPDVSHPLVMRLAPLYVMWNHQAQLTTFILTFFLTESFGGRPLPRRPLPYPPLPLPTPHAAPPCSPTPSRCAPRHAPSHLASCPTLHPHLARLLEAYPVRGSQVSTLSRVHCPPAVNTRLPRRDWRPHACSSPDDLPECF